MSNDEDNINPEWLKRIEDAQAITHDVLDGRRKPRLAYGSEGHPYRPRCRDCGATVGQLHVDGCCIERCPWCDGQAISCSCLDAVNVH